MLIMHCCHKIIYPFPCASVMSLLDDLSHRLSCVFLTIPRLKSDSFSNRAKRTQVAITNFELQEPPRWTVIVVTLLLKRLPNNSSQGLSDNIEEEGGHNVLKKPKSMSKKKSNLEPIQ